MLRGSLFSALDVLVKVQSFVHQGTICHRFSLSYEELEAQTNNVTLWWSEAFQTSVPFGGRTFYVESMNFPTLVNYPEACHGLDIRCCDSLVAVGRDFEDRLICDAHGGIKEEGFSTG